MHICTSDSYIYFVYSTTISRPLCSHTHSPPSNRCSLIFISHATCLRIYPRAAIKGGEDQTLWHRWHTHTFTHKDETRLLSESQLHIHRPIGEKPLSNQVIYNCKTIYLLWLSHGWWCFSCVLYVDAAQAIWRCDADGGTTTEQHGNVGRGIVQNDDEHRADAFVFCYTMQWWWLRWLCGSGGVWCDPMLYMFSWKLETSRQSVCVCVFFLQSIRAEGLMQRGESWEAVDLCTIAMHNRQTSWWHHPGNDYTSTTTTTIPRRWRLCARRQV